MPFGLTNPTAIFQTDNEDCLRPFIYDFAVCYFDNILIDQTNKAKHKDRVRKVIERVREFGLYTQAKKCYYRVRQVDSLRWVVSPDGIGRESDWVSTIEDWTTAECVRDVEVLLGFQNFYRQIIRKYAKVTTPISDLIKKAETFRTSKQPKWEWIRDGEPVLWKLERAFTDAPSLNHSDPAKLIILQTNANIFTIAGILNQYDSFGILRPVNFYPPKCTGAKQNCDTYNWELLAIVQTIN